MSKTFQKICERLCEKWGISICVLCDSFEEHQTHDVHGHFGKLRKQEPCLTKRFTRFREISFFKISRDCCLHTSSKCISEWRKLTQRNRHHYTENEVWLAEIEAKYMAPLKKKEKERTCTIFEIAMNITDLKKLLNSNNASLVSPYKSRNLNSENCLLYSQSLWQVLSLKNKQKQKETNFINTLVHSQMCLSKVKQKNIVTQWILPVMSSLP